MARSQIIMKRCDRCGVSFVPEQFDSHPCNPLPIHLSKWCCYDEDEMWCGEMPGRQTREIDEATCINCLTEAVAYGNAALARRGELRRSKKED
jgi:hypothetical protein